MTRPPVGLSGSLSGRTTTCPGVSTARLASSPIGRPVTVDRVGVQQPGLEQALGDQRDAAGLVEVGGDEAAAGLEVAQQRRARR